MTSTEWKLLQQIDVKSDWERVVTSERVLQLEQALGSAQWRMSLEFIRLEHQENNCSDRQAKDAIKAIRQLLLQWLFSGGMINPDVRMPNPLSFAKKYLECPAP